MAKYRVLIAATLVAGFCAGASGETDTMLSELARGTVNSLVMVRCTFDESSATGGAVGQAICIDKSGQFVSLAFSASMIRAKVKKCVIIPSGAGQKPLRAELISIDRATGLGFIKCTDPTAPQWTPITFVKQADLTTGKRVVSVGLMPGDSANTRYYGSASVSSVLRTPQPLVYVTAGHLTRVGSPVFVRPGAAVGIVGRQLGQAVEMVASRRRAQVVLTPMRDSAFFTPAEEIIDVIANRHKTTQMSWAGIAGFQAADMEVMNLSSPGVRVGKVIPGYPADKAGLKELDVIVQLDGRNLEQLGTPKLTAANLQRSLLRLPVGRKVSFTLANGKKLSLVLAPMPVRPMEAPRYVNTKLGLLVREKVMLDEYLITSPSARTVGLLVLNAPKGGQAQKGGLKAGDVITSVNAQPVRTVATISTIVDKALTDAVAPVINLLVQRGAESRSISIQLPR